MKILKTSLLALTLCAIPTANVLANDVKGSLRKAESKAQDVMSDTMITAKIKELFLENKSLPSLKIHVKTTDGIVTLTGSVENPGVKQLAIDLAQSVKDVKYVNSKLVIG